MKGAAARFHAALDRHLNIHREVTPKDFTRLCARAGVRIVDTLAVQRTIAGPTRCSRCRRKIMTVHTVAGLPFGEKCAQKVRAK